MSKLRPVSITVTILVTSVILSSCHFLPFNQNGPLHETPGVLINNTNAFEINDQQTQPTDVWEINQVQKVEPTIMKDCFSELKQPNSHDLPNSGLITLHEYWSTNQNWINDAYNYSFDNMLTRNIISKGISTIEISSDQSIYAIQKVANNSIQLFNSDGALIKTLENIDDTTFLENWLGTNSIVLSIDNHINIDDGYKYPKDIEVLNVSTEETRSLLSEYPEIDKANPGLLWDGGYTTVLNPQLTRVIYPGYIDKDIFGRGGQGYILRDLDNKETILQIASGNFLGTPKWSTNGEEAFIPNSGEGLFFIVSKEGRIKLDLGFRDKRFRLFTYIADWSPDGENIALWIESLSGPIRSANLGIYNLKTNTLTDFCISAGDASNGISPPFTPRWHKGGDYLATISNLDEDGSFSVIVVNIPRRVYFVVSRNEYPVGWVNIRN